MPSSSSSRSKSTSGKRSSPAPERGKTEAKSAGKPSQDRKSAPAPGKATPQKGAGDGAIGTYNHAIRWLLSHTDYEKMRIIPYNTRTFSLDRMRRLLALLDNPHESLKTVQIAGTKGKGSTCAMLASALQACGYAVGLYTSPHLIDLRERICINGQIISQSELTDLLKRIQLVEKDLGDDLPTFFEIMTAACLCYFAEQAVDIAVLETGMGGRLDSVTAVTPLVCGLTHISYDHMNVLGRELTAIAKEKAGIMKKGVPVISVEQDAGVAQVFEEHAAAVGAPLEFTGKQIEFSYRFEANRELGPHTRVSITTASSKWEHLAVPLPGEHQAHNCGLALGILDKLKGFGFKVPEDKAIVGLAATKIPGRMEQVWHEPRVIIDGAHNAHSIQALIRALGAHVAYDSLVVIFGCGQDKDINGMLKQLGLGADKVILTRARNNPRAVEPEELMARFNDLSGKMAQIAPDLQEALRLASRAVSREDLIVVTGSFYLVGEARKHFLDLAARRNRNHHARG